LKSKTLLVVSDVFDECGLDVLWLY